MAFKISENDRKEMSPDVIAELEKILEKANKKLEAEQRRIEKENEKLKNELYNEIKKAFGRPITSQDIKDLCELIKPSKSTEKIESADANNTIPSNHNA